ncbi:class I adenylate-forming enzyme family protein [Desulfoscipio sp. XC116]|uniref:class I adenylate-forming enzyme family protein n=1 Tax=Desulfoscipio sp. XC116 TaxID=3144975 RepID=UPI00325B8315
MNYREGLVSLTHDKLIRAAASKRPYKEALVDIETREIITYKELWLRSNKIANILIDLSLKKGDKIGTLGYECAEFPVIWLGIMKMGGVKIGLNWRYTAREMEDVINRSDTKAIIIGEAFIDFIMKFKDTLTNIKHYIVIGDNVPEGMISYKDYLSQASDKDPNVEIKAEDMCALFFTTGTTSAPKAAIRCHSDYVAAIFLYCWAWHYHPQMKELNCLPDFHIGGHYMIDGTLYVGGTSYVGRFNPEQFLKIIDNEKISYTTLPPTMMGLLIALPDNIKSRYDCSSVKCIGSGGSVYSAAIKDISKQIFPNAELHDAYNATEVGVTVVEPEDFEHYGCVGEPMIGMEVKIFNRKREELPPGTEGLIYTRGPSRITGYYKDLEAMEKCIIRDPTGDWFTLEDMGYIHPVTNLLYITGREKDIIITGDENVSPAEVEGVISNHFAVSEVSVLGISDKKWGEQVVAVIRVKEEYNLSEKDIKAYCKQNLAGFKIPKTFKFVEEVLPRKGFKIDRNLVRDKYF